MYKVIAKFADLNDNKHLYNAGDEFPRKGVDVTEDRIKELASSTNKAGKPLIKLVEEKKQTTTTKVADKPKRRKKANDADSIMQGTE